MKKVVLALAVVFSVAFVSCSSKDKKAEDTTAVVDSTEQVVENDSNCCKDSAACCNDSAVCCDSTKTAE